MDSEIDNLKYIELDSTYRNRNNYPNQFDYGIPYNNTNQGSTAITYEDAVLNSSPYTGSPTKRPGELFTGISIDPENIKLSIFDSNINNFYINSSLQIGSEFRSIISYNGTTKVATISSPFSILPDENTLYYTRKVPVYLNSDVSIYRKNTINKTVDQINLLTAAPSVIKDFYKGSYIRFTNGTHVGNTALITAYQPFGNVTTWIQKNVSSGSSSLISVTDKCGIVFSPFITGLLYSLSLNVESFESVSPGRSLLIEIREGSGLIGDVLHTEILNVVNTNGINYVSFILNSNPNLISNNLYTLTLLDVTVGGNNYGFLNVYGITPNMNYKTYNIDTYPKMNVYLLYGSSNIVWNQSLNTESSLFPSNTIVGLVVPVIGIGSMTLTNITINLTSFESVDIGRTVRFSVLNGNGMFGSLVYTTDIIISNTIPASDYNFSVSCPIVGGNIYTFTFEDITIGGDTTGYIYVYGINTDPINYVSYNITTYPKINIKAITSDVFSQATSQGYNEVLQNSEWGFLQRTNNYGTLSNVNVRLSTFDISSIYNGGSRNIQLKIRNSGGLSGDILYQKNYNIYNGIIQIGNNLTYSETLYSSQFGYCVALNYDGNILASSGIDDNSGVGAVWIFNKINNSWYETTKLMIEGYTGNPTLGSYISINDDGSVLAIGGPDDDGGVGAVWIFRRTDNIWEQETILIGSGYIAPYSYQGHALCLNASGNVLAVGAYGDDSDSGAVWMFKKINNVWTEIQKITNPSALSFGYSVALDVEGNILAVGAPYTSSFDGASYVYRYSNISSNWILETQLIATGKVGQSQEGKSISVYDDMVVVGGDNDSTNIGASWVFKYDGVIWNQEDKIIGYPSTINSYQGVQTSLKKNKNNYVLVVGGYGDNSDIGANWLFVKNNTITTFTGTITGTNINVSNVTSGKIEVGQIIKGSGVVEGTQITAFVTGSGYNGDYTVSISQNVSTNMSSIWKQQQKIVSQPSSSGQFQGVSVCLSGDANYLISGASGDSSNNGAVMVYNTNLETIQKGVLNDFYNFSIDNFNLNSTQLIKLIGNNYSGQSRQGNSSMMSGDGNTIVIGGDGDNSDIGAAWVFVKSGGNWIQQGDKLVPSDYIGTPMQGAYKVDMSSNGQTIVISAFNDDFNSGAAWIWSRYNIPLTFTGSISGTILTVTSIVGTIEFGSSICGNGITPSTQIVSFISGTGGIGTYTVNISQTTSLTEIISYWKQEQKLMGKDSIGNSQQGRQVSINDNGTIVSLGGNNDNGGIGAFWVFNKTSPINFTGTIVGYTLTVALPNNLKVGQFIYGNGVSEGTQIISDDSGGNYSLSLPHNFSGTLTSVWSQMGTKMSAYDYIGFGRIGNDLSFDSSGNVLAVNGYTDDNNKGAVWIWNRNDVEFSGYLSGSILTVLSISSGNILLGQNIYSGNNEIETETQIISFGTGTGGIGTYEVDVNNNVGSLINPITIYSNWSQVQKIVPIGDDIIYISSCVLSGDGNYLSFYSYSSNYGYTPIIYIYKKINNIYMRTVNYLRPTDSNGAGFNGLSLFFNFDGSILLVGSTSNNGGNGACWIYSRTNETWLQNGNAISVIESGTGFGGSVSLNNIGDSFISGGYNDNSSVGATWVFNINNLPPVIQSNSLYTCSLNDLSSIFGRTNIYGINTDSYYLTYGGSSVYPQLDFIVKNTGDYSIYTQPNNTINTPITNDFGFGIKPSSSGIVNNISLHVNITSIDGLTIILTILEGETTLISQTIYNDYTNGISEDKIFFTGDLFLNNTKNYRINISIISGSFILYGITPTINYVVYSTTVYPKININALSANVTAYQPTNNTYTDVITNNEMGYEFTVTNNCNNIILKILNTTFSTTSISINYKILSGSGLLGNVLLSSSFIQTNNDVRNFYTSASLPVVLNSGIYTLVLSTNTNNGIFYLYGINPVGSGYTSYNTSVIPNMYLVSDSTQDINDIFNQTLNESVYYELTGSEIGFKIVPNSSSFISSVVINLTSFNSIDSFRPLRLKIRTGSGLSGTIVYNVLININNNLYRSDYSLNVSPSLFVTSGNDYTITLSDETLGGSNGNITIYGINSNFTYISYNTVVYPKMSIGVLTPTLAFNQNSSPILSDTLSSTIEKGYRFEPTFSGNISNLSLLLTSFSTLGSREYIVNIREGEGLSGTLLYTGTTIIENSLTKTFTNIILNTPFQLSDNFLPFTISFIDTTIGHSTTGSLRLYGITPTNIYQSYNSVIYPNLRIIVPAFILTISPPQNLDGFLANNLDNIEFNSSAYDNSNYLYHSSLPHTRSNYYRVKLMYTILPKQLLGVSYGGFIENYPYIYVSIYNEGNRGAIRTLLSNNPTSGYAVFKIPTRQTSYDKSTSFYTFKECEYEQIIHFRPDQDIRVTYYLPDGTVINTDKEDTLSPDFPNPLLQNMILLTLKSIELDQIKY